MNWEHYRREDGSLNLVAAYNNLYSAERGCDQTYSEADEAHTRLLQIEELQPIKSRQIAAVAIVMARAVSGKAPQKY